MTTYYIDATLGNDGNAGTAPGAGNAWQTVAAPNAFSGFATGDSIVFKAGEVWEPIDVALSLNPDTDGFTGSSTLPSIIGRYGTGADPVLWGAAVTATWVDTTKTSVTGESVYSKDLSGDALLEPTVVLEDGTLYNFVPWSIDLDTTIALAAWTAGSFTYDSEVSYIETSDGTAPSNFVIRVGQQPASSVNRKGIFVRASEYVTISSLDLRGFTGNGIELNTNDGDTIASSNNTVTGCTVYATGGTGILIINASSIITDLMVSNAVLGNTVTSCGAAGVSAAGADVTGSFNVVSTPIRNNTINLCGWAAGANGIDTAYAQVFASDNSISEQIDSSADGEGILFDNKSNGSIAERNTITGCEGAGVLVSNNSINVTVRNNIASSNTDYGVIIKNGANSAQVINNTIYNNTAGGFRNENDVVNLTLKNNIFSENGTVEIQAITVAGLEIDFNCVYHSAGGTFMSWDDGGGADAYNWADWLTNSGQDVNSINTNPLMTNPAGADFTIPFNSPCRRAGVYVGGGTDFNQKTWHSPPDIGAHRAPGAYIRPKFNLMRYCNGK